ncbi:MAG: radical SAM family heme chaperone HemW [Dehalococcoidia bacterium]|nr:MAG: radical SAM family heme chaperone HemW [Dehalococcoidia bacterium]
MSNGSVSLYVHIPFCRSKCSYCDFNSYAGLESLIEPYVGALLAEMALWREATQHMDVATAFLGGGTPSVLPLTEVERIMTALRQHFLLTDDAEVSFEANPGTVDRAYLQALRSLGVNRLSLGVQSFHADELATLGRIHTAAEAREAFDTARRAGFDNVNLDLIYGLPRQTMAAWQDTLREAVALRPDHLSLYALTLEEGTPLADDVAHGRLPPPDTDLTADMYLWAGDALAAAGYQHYEISNWALPNRQCRHNLAYWLNEPYLGLGAGAHSCFGGFRFANVKDPHRYVPLVEESALGDGRPAEGLPPFLAGLRHIASTEQMTAARAMAETVVLGLRLTDGLPLKEFRRRFGQELISVYGAQVQELEAVGLLEQADGCLRLTASARLLGNEVFQRFLPD